MDGLVGRDRPFRWLALILFDFAGRLAEAQVSNSAVMDGTKGDSVVPWNVSSS